MWVQHVSPLSRRKITIPILKFEKLSGLFKSKLLCTVVVSIFFNIVLQKYIQKFLTLVFSVLISSNIGNVLVSYL